ncbi:MAG: M28 family metallopeptidase [Acidobacteria bacterium]|nr:M28 family metallopeptidase [Acidobacteriota bacterium]
MRYRTVCLLGTASVLILASMASVCYAEGVAGLLDELSQDRYTEHLRNQLYTQFGNNRYAPDKGPEHDPARDYIASQFSSYGLETYLDEFTWTRRNPPFQGTLSGVNVVAKLKGKRYPDQMYILGAHYDSAATPGADDNASGVAGLLEAARVLAGHQFEYTILFIAFDFEEIGCSGASSYAQRHLDDKILGMVEMDMIAYSDGRNRAEIWTATPDPNPVSTALADATARYASDLTVRIGGNEGASDHGPFAAAGFNSAMLSEATPYSPYYHRRFDSVTDFNGNDIVMPDGTPYLDYAYATKMLRGVMGWAAEAAVLAQ